MFKFLTVLAPSNPPDFALGTISPITMGTGETASPLVTVNSFSGFSAAVALSASGAPSGVSATFNPNPVTPPGDSTASSILTLNLAPSVTPSTFMLTVAGNSGSLTHTTKVSVTVTATTGRLGASHQTGWTGWVAKLIQLFGMLDPQKGLETGKAATFMRHRK